MTTHSPAEDEVARLRDLMETYAAQCDTLRAELAAEQENARGWQNDYDHEAKAGNAIYANETRDWSTTMKSLTYKEIEARLDAVIALCDPDGPDVIWDEDLTVAYVLADAARAAATGVES